MKGRLALDKLNTAIDEMQKLLQAKYKILSMAPAKMIDKTLKKYKVFLFSASRHTFSYSPALALLSSLVSLLAPSTYSSLSPCSLLTFDSQAYKEAETNETKGLYFLTDADMAESVALRQGDATGKAVIGVLRHLHRIKDLGMIFFFYIARSDANK